MGKIGQFSVHDVHGLRFWDFFIFETGDRFLLHSRSRAQNQLKRSITFFRNISVDLCECASYPVFLIGNSRGDSSDVDWLRVWNLEENF